MFNSSVYFANWVDNMEHCLLTPWNIVLENLTGFQLVKKFPAYYGTWRFITAFTSARHLTLSRASSIQSILPHPISWRSVLILSSHLLLGLPSVPLVLMNWQCYEWLQSQWTRLRDTGNRLMSVEPWCNNIDGRTRRKTCPSVTLSTTNPTWTGLGSNPVLHRKRPSINHMSHGAANSLMSSHNTWMKIKPATRSHPTSCHQRHSH